MNALRDDIAIIGMACIFPGAPNVQAYWQNIVAKVDATSDPPQGWDTEEVFDPDSTANDRIYCQRGGYLGDLTRFNPLEYGVMPRSIEGGDPEHFLVLRVAHEALADAGYVERPMDRQRVEVILGWGAYMNRGYTALVQHCFIVDQTLRILKQLHPEHTRQELEAIKQELKASLPPFNAEVAPALVPNIMTGRIANRLDLMGPNYTVDAACASSLIAVQHGMQDLLAHKCDMAIVGGAHAATPAHVLMLFCQLNALSRRGQIRPFDKDADGTLLGEGLGMMVLKRQEDAERDGDRIYACIKGIGTASDGRALGLLAPRIEGEELALRRAYEAAGLSPHTVELIEAHGTATPLGDLTEIQALSRVFGPRHGAQPWCALGSVKSMIGHPIPAAGIAGLIKTALALYHKILPPTINCDEPNPKLELEKTPFYINTQTRPWIHGKPEPRRAGVNAFGFGGINAHAILEEYSGDGGDAFPGLLHRWDTEVCILQEESRRGLISAGERLLHVLSNTSGLELKDLAYTLNCPLQESAQYRLAIVANSPQDLEHKLIYGLQRLADPQCTQIKDRSGIFFFEEPLSRQGTLAFLFPGEGSQYINMLSDLCLHFPEVRAWFDLLDRAFINHKRNDVPSQVIFPPPTGTADRDRAMEGQLWQTDMAGEWGVFAANQALYALLSRLGLRPQAIVGHSVGESSALLASGAIEVENTEDILQYLLERDSLIERASMEGKIPAGVLLAVGPADRDLVASLLERAGGSLYVTMDNCPHQVVLCGTQPIITQAMEHLRSKGAVCTILPFNRAYHTPLWEPVCQELQALERLKLVPPKVEIYSCATAKPYPHNPHEMRQLAVEQWIRPVRFRETIEAMYEAGIRIFVEVGARGNLTAFVEDILRSKPHLAVAANVFRRSGITQLNHLAALLAAHQVPMQLDRLYAHRAPRRLSLKGAEAGAEKPGARAGAMRLSTELPRLQLGQGHPTASPGVSTSAGTVPSTPTGIDSPVQHQPTPTGDVGHDQAARAPAREAPGSGGTPASAPAASRAPMTQTLQRSDRQQPGGLRSEAMQAYLETMERFLDMQQEVMAAFMAREGTWRD